MGWGFGLRFGGMMGNFLGMFVLGIGRRARDKVIEARVVQGCLRVCGTG